MRLEAGYTFQAMQISTTQTTTNPGRARLQGALVVGQVGLSFVLLVAAGLLLRSTWTTMPLTLIVTNSW